MYIKLYVLISTDTLIKYRPLPSHHIQILLKIGLPQLKQQLLAPPYDHDGVCQQLPLASHRVAPSSTSTPCR